VVYFRVFAAVALASANVAPVAAQVLPPPLLPGQSDITQRLVAAFRAKDERAYAALLSDQVEVFEDGKKIASDKAEWLRRFGPMLSADGVYFKLAPGYAATGRFLFIEYFNSMASWGAGPPRHCCWSSDAVAYDIADGKIIRIQRLRGGDALLDETGKQD
jgi:hypothetical protein